MKITHTSAILLFAIAAVVCIYIPASRFLSWQKDYAEAESLVSVIWPMAGEMKRFAEKHGTSPSSLDELAMFSTDQDYEILRHYPHEFTSAGTQRFSLRVNSRFAFVIDDDYMPQWSQWSNINSAPMKQ